jgi:hypothetical protein
MGNAAIGLNGENARVVPNAVKGRRRPAGDARRR